MSVFARRASRIDASRRSGTQWRAAFSYFFRREVEKDDELANGLIFDGLKRLSAAQATAFKKVGLALDSLRDHFDNALGAVALELTRARARGFVYDTETFGSAMS